MTDGDLPADLPADLALALRLADVADAIALARFGAADLHISTKPDRTPVTDADRAVEVALRDVLAQERPADAVLGEELGARPGEGPGESGGHSEGHTDEAAQRRCWVLDPIDGTANFLRGVPVWATLVGLSVDDVPTVGVVSAPALGARWWAATGHGAWARTPGRPRRRCQVSAVIALGDASASYSDLVGWRARGLDAALLGLLEQCWRTRAYGDFYSYMLVAEGAVDWCSEPALARHDVVALVPVLTEAGGRVTTLDGDPVRGAGSVLASNGHLHDALLGALRRAGTF